MQFILAKSSDDRLLCDNLFISMISEEKYYETIVACLVDHPSDLVTALKLAHQMIPKIKSNKALLT